jgi:serine O-acetyltransferase
MSAEERPELATLVDGMVASYRRDPRGQHVNRRYLPSRQEIHEAVDLLFELFYPGYFGRQDLTDENLPFHVGTLLSTLREKLERQIETCLCFAREMEGRASGTSAAEARRAAATLLGKLPAIRDRLIGDVQAAYDGDPAAQSLDEVILAYPGLLAVTVHRVAHELYLLDVPLMPRIMSEWAHTQSGADIHPGATLGDRFFIDHASGVVIGETTTIGDGVKLYQGVTLGALSHPRDASGRVVRHTKRHPTVGDNATLYANAIVLGGTTEVGSDALVGGSVFLTRSVPPGSRVAMKPPELSVRGVEPMGLEFEI